MYSMLFFGIVKTRLAETLKNLEQRFFNIYYILIAVVWSKHLRGQNI